MTQFDTSTYDYSQHMVSSYGDQLRADIDYQGLLCLDGSEITIDESDDNYQGDTYCLLKHPTKGVGYVCFGWGSCAGCDAIRRCSSAAELRDIHESLLSGTTWFPTYDEFVTWFKARDWKGQFNWYTTGGGFEKFAAYFGVYKEE